jgi:hypothetical protein
VTIQRASLTAFSAAIVDSHGRRNGVVAPCTSVAAALEHAQRDLVRDTTGAV